MTSDNQPLCQIWLNFLEKGADQKKHWRENLSAVAKCDDTLFAADDEHPAICRLVAHGDGYKHEDTITLASLGVDLPDGDHGEMDIEGLGVEGNHLWIVGSHAPAREQPKKKDDDAQALHRLREVRDDPNRHFLGYVTIDKTQPVSARAHTCQSGRVRVVFLIFLQTTLTWVGSSASPRRRMVLTSKDWQRSVMDASSSVCADRCFAAGHYCLS
jgi:hypothetical protein